MNINSYVEIISGAVTEPLELPKLHSFIEIILGAQITPTSRIIFTPVQFFPPDVTGASNLAPNEKLIFRSGDNILLTAPEKFEGKKFNKWQIRNDNIVLLESIENPISINITGNLSILAMYEPISVTTWVDVIVGATPIEPLQLSELNSFVEITLI